MDLKEIYENLCYRDPRNPWYNDLYASPIYYDEEDKPTPREGCACDNCFYGKDKLAVEILRYKGMLDSISNTYF